MAVEVSRGRVDRVEDEPVDGVGDALGVAVYINDGNVGRCNGSREGRSAGGRLHGPVEIRGAEVLGRGGVLVAQVAGRESLGNCLDRVIQGLLFDNALSASAPL